MARIRISAQVPPALYLEIVKFHQRRLDEARLKGLKVCHSRKGLGWASPHGLSEFWSFSATLELVLKSGLQEARRERAELRGQDA